MQIQKRKTIDIPPEDLEGKKNFLFSRQVLYVFLAAALVSWAVFSYVRDNAYLKPAINYQILKTSNKPQEPYLPDITGITVENIEAKVRRPVLGTLVFDKLKDYPEFGEFMEDDAPRKLRLVQHSIHPKAIIIKSGHFTWPMLVASVKRIDPKGELIRSLEGNRYLVRAPIGVLIGASLTISGKDASEILLSKQANAFLVNAGEMFILRTAVKGWDEQKNANAAYVDKKDFRPFITSWSGGHLYIAGSTIQSLGYLKGKSYGVSYSGCTSCLKVNPFLPASTGVMVGNDISDMFYGFYSYEAEDVAIVGNKFHDNIIYAIDPHDRSKRLIIANNETYGTHYKHGIIVSREVNNSWIFGNHSHHNKGSGIMIDRISRNNIIANNLSEHNEQDGLTFFESQDNMTWGNQFINNKRNGVLIRNSWNIKLNYDDIMLNDGVAVEVYATDLKDVELHRDFALDPFTLKSDLSIYGAKIKSTGPSIFKMDMTDFIDLSALQVWVGSDLFPNKYSYRQNEILKAAESKDTVVRLDIGFKSKDTIKFPTKHE